MLESLVECLGRSIDAASSFGVSLRSQLVEETSTSGGKCALKCTDVSESELLRCVLESTPRMWKWLLCDLNFERESDSLTFTARIRTHSIVLWRNQRPLLGTTHATREHTLTTQASWIFTLMQAADLSVTPATEKYRERAHTQLRLILMHGTLAGLNPMQLSGI